MKRVWNTNYVKAAVNTVARSNSTLSISTWIIRERPANRSKFSTPLWLRDSHRPTKEKIKGQRNGRQREEGERRCLKAYFAVRNAAKEGWNAPLGNSNYRGAFSFFTWHVAKLFSLSPLFHFPTVFFPILIMTNSVYLDIYGKNTEDESKMRKKKKKKKRIKRFQPGRVFWTQAKGPPHS